MLSLKAGIEDLKQAKTLMSEANHIMSDHVSRLKTLEEENVALKAQLDDWKGNAEGFQPDAYMKLPVDADGEPIRLKDWVWYVGIDAEITKDDPQQVVGLVFDLGMNGIYAVTRDYPDKAISPKMLTHRAPEPPDSWEKLEEDAAKEVCVYAGAPFSIVNQDMYSCTGCRFDDCSSRKTSCWLQMNSELMARAKRLAGAE